MSLSQFVSQKLEGKEEARASEVAALIVEMVCSEWLISPEVYETSPDAKQVVWRGATAWARDLMKRPETVDGLLNPQGELPLGKIYSEFVWVGSDADGTIWVRRRSLTRERYETMLSLLETKRNELSRKLDNYRIDYDTALSFWSSGLTFGEAMRMAKDSIVPVTHRPTTQRTTEARA